MRDLVPYGQQAQDEYGLANIKEVESFSGEITKRYPLAAICLGGDLAIPMQASAVGGRLARDACASRRKDGGAPGFADPGFILLKKERRLCLPAFCYSSGPCEFYCSFFLPGNVRTKADVAA